MLFQVGSLIQGILALYCGKLVIPFFFFLLAVFDDQFFEVIIYFFWNMEIFFKRPFDKILLLALIHLHLAEHRGHLKYLLYLVIHSQLLFLLQSL